MQNHAETLASLLGAFMRRAASIPENAASSDHRCQKIASDIMRIIQHGSTSGPFKIERRGRKRTHDKAWAWDCLLAMAIESPDGLPHKQLIMANRLRGCFEHAARPVPGDTWLNKVVGEFYRSSNRMAEDAILRFRRSPDLQATFANQEEYVAWDRARIMLDRQWHESLLLQEKYATPQEYIAQRSFSRNSRIFADDPRP